MSFVPNTILLPIAYGIISCFGFFGVVILSLYAHSLQTFRAKTAQVAY